MFSPKWLKSKLIFLPFILVAAGLLIITLALFSPPVTKESSKPTPSPSFSTSQVVKGEQISQTQNITSNGIKVTKVIDGDTIEIEGGQRVRYIGIDTPETVHPSKLVQCFGREASAKNKELVEGKTVELEKDISETDKYGRLLRYVYAGGTFVNQYLITEGYAHSSTYPPDIKYQNQFTEAEKEARENNRGLWGVCQGQSAATTSDCPIKGNISSSGEKIYHMPGQRYYEKTVIDEGKGERWFCSEDEAIQAGWRKSKT